MVVFARVTPHPNPPELLSKGPQEGRGFIVAVERFPSPLEGEGREGGEPREDSFQEYANG